MKNKPVSVLGLAKKYGLHRRTVSGRLSRHGFKSVVANGLISYYLTPEIDKILREPVIPHVPYVRKKESQEVQKETPKKAPSKEKKLESLAEFVFHLLGLAPVAIIKIGKKPKNDHVHLGVAQPKSGPSYEINENTPMNLFITIK